MNSDVFTALFKADTRVRKMDVPWGKEGEQSNAQSGLVCSYNYTQDNVCQVGLSCLGCPTQRGGLYWA
jgi:hypothetical protein